MQENPGLLDTLTEPQQLEVYQLMAVTDIADGNIAARYYIDAHHDINRAAQIYFDRGTAGMNATPHEFFEDFGGHQDFGHVQPEPQRVQRNQGNELHIQYKKYLQRKEIQEEEKGMGDSFKETASSVMGGFRGIWNYIMPIALRGETEGGEQFIVHFRKNYEDLSRLIKFNSGTFEKNVWYATQVKKPLLVYLHTESPVFRPIPQRLFRDAQLTDFMSNNFHLLGLLANTETSQNVLKHIHSKHCPCLAVFRSNLLDETILVEFITLTNETTPGQVLEQLKNLERNYYAIITEEERIKRDVVRGMNNQRRRDLMVNFGDVEAGQMYAMQQMQQPRPRPQQSPEELQRIEEARILRQIQQEEFKEVERKILEQQEKRAEEEKIRKEKEAQEEQARIQREYEERIREEEAKRKEEEKENLKKSKLASLPVEPGMNEAGVISIVFRLPDGNRAERRFIQSDKIQILYDYIDTRDIQFDSSTVRYDLMQPRPFLCLDDKEKTLNDYFEGSDQEVIVVRELTE